MRDVAGGGQDHYYLLEELYSVAGLAGAVGQLEEMYVYDTYGQATAWAWRPGDVNRNGMVNGLDAAKLGSWRNAGSPLADLNEDGTLDYGQNPNLDSAIIQAWQSTTPLKVTYSQLDNPFMFTGRLTDTINDDDVLAVDDDSSGFRRIQDNRNRSYDPHHGRWFQRDPLGVRPDAPEGSINTELQYHDGMNVYRYVNCKPTGLIDANGFGESKASCSCIADNMATGTYPTTEQTLSCCELAFGYGTPGFDKCFRTTQTPPGKTPGWSFPSDPCPPPSKEEPKE